MAYQFNGFRATMPVVRLIDPVKGNYEVFFVLYDAAGAKHHMRYKAGINCLSNKTERKKQAEATADVLREALKNKWNPLLEKYPDFNRKADQQVLHLDQALDFSLNKKKQFLSQFSIPDYSGTVRFIKKAASATGHLMHLVTMLERKDIRIIIDKAKEQNSWSNKARNKYLTIFKALLSVLVDEEMIKYNPAEKIRNEPEEQGAGYRRLTDDEKGRVADHLHVTAPDFFEYLMFIYDDGIRRKETLLLQVRDVNLMRKEIMIRAEVAKTNRARIVPITDTIRQILLRREIWKLPADHYIFSSDKFKPGPVAYHPNTPTKWWRTMVIDGLGIDCKMYSLKHKGADDKILADIDLDALRNLYGHRSQQMTEGYAKAVKGKYKQQIIDKAPAFAKVVEMKKAK